MAFAGDSDPSETCEEEWQLSQEHVLLLTALQEQQACHEENVQRMFKHQLRLISLKLATLQGVHGGNPDDVCREEPVHPPRSSWQPFLLLSGRYPNPDDTSMEEGQDLTESEMTAPQEVSKADVRPDLRRVSFEEEVGFKVETSQEVAHVSFQNEVGQKAEQQDVAHVSFQNEVDQKAERQDPSSSPAVTLTNASSSPSFHLDAKMATSTRTEQMSICSPELPGQKDASRHSTMSFLGTRTKFWERAEKAFVPDFDFKSTGVAHMTLPALKRAILDRDARFIARMIERSRVFQFLIEVIIFANGVMLGVQQNWLAQNLGKELEPWWIIVDGGFAIIFSFELLVRFTGAGRYFIHYRNPEVWWNLFDTLLVISANLEVSFKLMTAKTIVDMSTGRILRMMRLVRVIRVVRVLRFFKDLRVMVLSILSSLRPLVFALCLLGMLIYVVSVFFMHFLTEELFYLKQQGDTAAFDSLEYYYGSLTSTTYTLFMSISGGVSWGEVAFPLWRISRVLGVAFCLYVAFSVFCVLNIITGIFVEEATTKTCQDEEHMVIRELEKRKRLIAEAKRFFKEADKDGSDSLEWPEFKERLDDIRMQKLLENLGIDVFSYGPRNVFEMFDYDGNGCIDISEFTAGLQRLRGGARSIEIAAVRSDQKKLLAQVRNLSKLLQDSARSPRWLGDHVAASTSRRPSRKASNPSPKHGNSTPKTDAYPACGHTRMHIVT